jgi:hypothetical protein
MSTYADNQHPNRESWLKDVADRLRPVFAELAASLPARLRIAIGFPSTGRRAKATGECWDSSASSDGTFEILVRPDLAETEGALAMPVAAALARELIHAAVGLQAGKGPRYRKVALGLGLLGPMRATIPGPAFLALMTPILDDAGPLPHARLHTERQSRADGDDVDDTPVPVSTRPRKQSSRHVRCVFCPTCGYVVRTARKWIDQIGPPHSASRGHATGCHCTVHGNRAGDLGVVQVGSECARNAMAAARPAHLR